MNALSLASALRLTPPICLGIVGAGGKSAALFRLGHELLDSHPTVLLTTSTHLGAWQAASATEHLVLDTDADEKTWHPDLPAGLLLITGPLQGERWSSLTPRQFSWLYEISLTHHCPLLIEADGARQRPLKAPADHEPVIPPFVATVLVVAGISGIWQPLDETHVHRPHLFARLSGLEIGTPITPEACARVLSHPEGGLKGIPPQARRLLLLNQADTEQQQAIAARLAGMLQNTYPTIVIASLQNGLVFSVHERIAGIVLAAGEGRRFGQIKQLLEWRGKPMVRHVAEVALSAGLSPVIVVTGAVSEQVAVALKELPVVIVHNPAWKEGQSTSVRAGLAALPSDCGAAIFLLADQPLVTPPLLRALVETHQQTQAPTLAPLVGGRRTTPVLFDRVTFPALMRIQGDVGGRAIFGQFPPRYLSWHDEGLLIDLDTPEEWHRLQDE
ncbi:MAG: selenium cofactor biosynthesis protein YqeC [Anaerolineales bacterium]|nr:selenium cofactor biosynthesis protein YqeC [Anaerolineales bacterium]